jgi:hypothetical protein
MRSSTTLTVGREAGQCVHHAGAYVAIERVIRAARGYMIQAHIPEAIPAQVAHVGRQDSRREANASGIGGSRFAVPHARLAHRDGTDPGHTIADLVIFSDKMACHVR